VTYSLAPMSRVRLLVALLLAVVSVTAATTVGHAATYSYDLAQTAFVKADLKTASSSALPQVSYRSSRQVERSPVVPGRSTTSALAVVATNKGPIAEQIALETAKSGNADEELIIRRLSDEARLDACYGTGEWVKMQYVLRCSRNVTGHWFRNLTTGQNVQFKFV
jgi:hypothetical protein